mmetsp:Transcript_7196/g.17390  ORF Transcript_7196/g.17390 Transcript_7196/m.17390 type:complete len:81 (-) Transcript_7196:1425-1667(-)
MRSWDVPFVMSWDVLLRRNPPSDILRNGASVPTPFTLASSGFPSTSLSAGLWCKRCNSGFSPSKRRGVTDFSCLCLATAL